MNPNGLSVTATTDQEEVAKLVRRYNLLAVPVVDDENKLMGIVTVDDVVDVIYDEATEDMLLMAGGSKGGLETRSVMGIVRARLPWLLVSCVGGLAAIQIISHYQMTLIYSYDTAQTYTCHSMLLQIKLNQLYFPTCRSPSQKLQHQLCM